jgi:hypothetical protein
MEHLRMPFYHFDDFDPSEFGIEDTEPQKSQSGEGFKYEGPAEAQFDFRELKGLAALMFQMLTEQAVTKIRVTYDGGYDEGFAHFDGAWIGDEAQATDSMLLRLAEVGAKPRILEAIKKPGSTNWYNAEQLFSAAAPERAVHFAMDDLAHPLAEKLVGRGYGTGEYQLYGAFTADLRTGRLLDDPAAKMPPNMELE